MSCSFNGSQNFGASRGGFSRGGYASAGSRRSTGGYQRSQSYAGASRAAAGHSGSNYSSQIEQAVINAKQPIQTDARETVQAGQYRGLYLNKSEVDQFRGPVPIDQYRINEDPNPEVIKKRLDKLKYIQEVAVRYLNPPPGPKPGDLIVREKQSTIPPGPPLVLRQEGQGASTPAPQIFREAPPKKPCAIPEQVVEVDGEPVPPPARRVVVEKLSNLPAKPQNVLIEKWLPYKPQKRRVVYQKSCATAAENPRNLVIEWEAPEVEVEKVCKNLGVVDADPEEYVRRYGSELKQASEIPNLCDEGNQCGAARTPTPRQPTPRQPTPAASGCGCGSGSGEVPELEGDVAVLRRVDLERHGLGAYRRFVQ